MIYSPDTHDLGYQPHIQFYAMSGTIPSFDVVQYVWIHQLKFIIMNHEDYTCVSAKILIEHTPKP